MKLIDRMGGNPQWLYQGATEPLGLSETGRSVFVSSMPLKGSGEARCATRRTNGMGGNPCRPYQGADKLRGLSVVGRSTA
jgi:hypothetical protein